MYSLFEKLKIMMAWKSILQNTMPIMKSLVVLRNWERHYCSKSVLKIQERGMFADIFPEKCTNEVQDLLNKGSQTVYAGFDPTADSLHIGNFLILMNLFHWQRSGHQVLILLGGATARIGDPSGKSKERKELFKAEVEKNCEKISHLLRKIIENHEITYQKKPSKKLKPIRIVNNADWYRNMNVLEFIGQIGRFFRVGTMLGKQSVKDRMNSGSGISFTEFSYQILQAYDWLRLFEDFDCRFQIGGNDQYGNIVAGYEYIQRIHDKKAYGLTVPLVTSEEGDKYGKTAGNAMWLSKEKTTPFQLYQFLIRKKDCEIQKLLLLYTFESISNILEIMNEHWKNPEKRLAQKTLAEQVTLLIHGEEGLRHAELATSALYDHSVEVLSSIEASDMKVIFKGSTLVELLLKPGTTVLQASLSAGCFKTENDAIRIITSGGFYINQQRIANFEEVLTPASHILPNNITLMRVGKKHYTIVKWL